MLAVPALRSVVVQGILLRQECYCGIAILHND